MSIKDPEADRLARQLAELTGESLTDAVKQALNDRIALETRRRSKTLDSGRLEDIVRQLAALPTVDGRTPEELIGYDAAGMPSR